MAELLTLKKLQEIAHATLPAGSSVWLYGSRARGDEKSDSDWDLLILLNKPAIEDTDFDSISYPLIEYGWHFGADISPQLYTKSEWDKMSFTPYYHNVEHDKKVIYES